MNRSDVILALRAVVAAAVLPGTATIVVPWLLLRGGTAVHPVAILPLALGAAGLVWCITDFARLGRGTLAPLDPPRFVVRGGLYRWVRNPMYVCVLIIVLSEAVLFASRAMFTWAALVGLGFHLFVVFYEEPGLRRRFESDYEAYLEQGAALDSRETAALALRGDVSLRRPDAMPDAQIPSSHRDSGGDGAR